MGDRKVMCSHFKEELEGLDKPPLPGEVGRLIYERVSKKAWELWRDDVQLKVINEYRLNMAEKEDYEFLKQQMLAFLGLAEDQESVEVENPERGRNG